VNQDVNTRALFIKLKFGKFRNRDKWYGNFTGNVPKTPEIVEFPKSDPFNREFFKLARIKV